MSQYDKFYGYLANLLKSHQKISELLLEKIGAAERFDLDTLDRVMKEEQAYVLGSKSFDANIEKFRGQLSFRGEKLSEIIEEFPEEEQQRFRELFYQLKNSLAEAQALNEKCQQSLEGRLDEVKSTLRELDKNKVSEYSAQGETDKASEGDNPPRFLSKTI